MTRVWSKPEQPDQELTPVWMVAKNCGKPPRDMIETLELLGLTTTIDSSGSVAVYKNDLFEVFTRAGGR
ncbi:hypothetical protein [Pseudonocardia sp. NPDC049635]|uniref:hypothetical protein n=1 Tax=Pseudonocardia sp. NPDC049635 TaxID=3155506 RepID=UPI0033C819E1